MKSTLSTLKTESRIRHARGPAHTHTTFRYTNVNCNFQNFLKFCKIFLNLLITRTIFSHEQSSRDEHRPEGQRPTTVGQALDEHPRQTSTRLDENQRQTGARPRELGEEITVSREEFLLVNSIKLITLVKLMLFVNFTSYISGSQTLLYKNN